MLALATLHRNSSLIPDFVRPLFSMCQPPYTSVLFKWIRAEVTRHPLGEFPLDNYESLCIVSF